MTITRARPAGHPAVGRGDRGAVSLEVVVLFPAALLLVFGALQAALWYHATTVATAAAAAGVNVGRAEDGTVASAVEATRSVLQRSGGPAVLDQAAATGTRSATSMSVTVTGSAPQLIPGLFSAAVDQTVTGAVERVTVPGSP